MTRVPHFIVLLLAAAGCAEDTAGDGEPCERAQDCAGSLVCALTEEGGDIRICTEFDRTRPQTMCTPGVSDVPCDLVLLREEGEPCESRIDCRDPLVCAPDGDAGNEGVCTPVGDGG